MPQREKSDRFFLHVNKDGPVPAHRPDLGPCWDWTGSQSHDGYGLFYDDARRGHIHRSYAHKWLWEQENGPVPAGLELDHLCFNRLCSRPGHLEPVTHAENMRRRTLMFSIHAAKTHCPAGHPYDEANTYRHGGKRHCRACGLSRRLERRIVKLQAA